ncbi:hypothetical protein [Clostridium hydrogenum]|uniref:hypothetical protein n=1 Tax=Clostridium hydrogenum TaxID=2855764 RepID=UPI001F3E0BB7|nr:hypothetical protein [Clostridium hydrogenum]
MNVLYKKKALLLIIGIFIFDLAFLILLYIFQLYKNKTIFPPITLFIILFLFFLIKCLLNVFKYKNLYVKLNGNNVFINYVLGTCSFNLNEIDFVTIDNKVINISSGKTKYKIKLSQISNAEAIKYLKSTLKEKHDVK